MEMPRRILWRGQIAPLLSLVVPLHQAVIGLSQHFIIIIIITLIYYTPKCHYEGRFAGESFITLFCDKISGGRNYIFCTE